MYEVDKRTSSRVNLINLNIPPQIPLVLCQYGRSNNTAFVFQNLK